MKYSQIFGKTLRDDQKEADVTSANLLLRAGYVRQLAAGIYTYLHFGQRCMRKIEQVIREEMDAIGGDEICMPIVHPAEIWQKTNRWYEIDASMARFKDRNERDMVLAMTHEEVVAHLATTEIDTYKQLPKLIYQIYTKFRDEPRSRGGLIRVREFTMKDSYSLDRDEEGLQAQYVRHYNAYFRIFSRLGLPAISVLSDTGMMGGKMAHEYMYLTDIGEDTIFVSESSGYRANKEVATFHKTFRDESPQSMEKIFTPDKKTIADLVDFMGLSPDRFGKVVFYTGKFDGVKKVVVAVVPGHLEVNLLKIQKLLGVGTLTPSVEEEILEIGSVPGYASPVGIDRDRSIIVLDELIAKDNNWIVGANEKDYHFKNACHERDFNSDIIGDIVNAFEGAPCPISKVSKLQAKRGIEIGNIFQLGTKYTEAMGAHFTDQDGRSKPIVMGSYGIGVGRLLACLCEEYHDEFGLMLPIAVAPYQVIITALLDSEETEAEANAIYDQLRNERIEVLLDDRAKKQATPGVKFRDADLIGIPIRITISKKSLTKGGVELKVRGSKEIDLIPVDEILATVQSTLTSLWNPVLEMTKYVEKWQGS